MSDYIKRESVLELAWSGKIISNDNFKTVRKLLQSIPAADVRENRHGKWNRRPTGSAYQPTEEFFCSECGDVPWWCAVDENVLPPFCPNCGAEMEYTEEA